MTLTWSAIRIFSRPWRRWTRVLHRGLRCRNPETCWTMPKINVVPKLDLIAANQVGIAGIGFESEQNALHVLWEGGEKNPRGTTNPIGHELIALIAGRYHGSRSLN